MSLRENIRSTLRGVVATLATPMGMLDYAIQVPSVNVIGEVYCQWFDDVYFPDDEQFRGAFSQEELRALAKLNSELVAVEQAVDHVTLAELIAAPWWNPVQRAAQEALRCLSNSGGATGSEGATGSYLHT